jgi:hypothetical protein
MKNITKIMKLFKDSIDSEESIKHISDKLNEARFMKSQMEVANARM